MISRRACAPAVGEPQRGSALAPVTGKAVVAGISVDVQHALEAREHPVGVLTATARGVTEDDRRRVGSVVGPVVPQHGPEVAGLGPPTAGIEDGRGRLVHEEARPCSDMPGHPIDDGAQVEGGAAGPVRQGGAIDGRALAGHDLRLPVQGQMIGELRDDDMRERGLGRQPALDQRGWRGRLPHPRPALRADVAGAHGDDHAEARRDDVESFGAVLADPDHPAAAAWAGQVVRLDHPLLARQVLGQRARAAVRLGRAVRLRRWLRGRSGLGLRLDDCHLDVLEGEFELVGRELLG